MGGRSNSAALSSVGSTSARAQEVAYQSVIWTCPLKGGKLSDWQGGVRVNAFATGSYLPEKMQGQKLTGKLLAPPPQYTAPPLSPTTMNRVLSHISLPLRASIKSAMTSSR